jgi:ABC-type iron transport system FetAB permease component
MLSVIMKGICKWYWVQYIFRLASEIALLIWVLFHTFGTIYLYCKMMYRTLVQNDYADTVYLTIETIETGTTMYVSIHIPSHHTIGGI